MDRDSLGWSAYVDKIIIFYVIDIPYVPTYNIEVPANVLFLRSCA